MTQEVIRSQFPGLQTDFVFFENAGGSQAPGCVIDAMTDFMKTAYVQTWAPYPASEAATKVFVEAHDFVKVMVNADGVGECALGPSSSVLLSHLATAVGKTLVPGDRIVISSCNHEANINPWVRLESQGIEIVFWDPDPVTTESSVDELKSLLNERTKIVAVPHTSNLLGDTMPLNEIVEAAHSVGAQVCADGVAYASHAAVDVQDSGVDFYVYSCYKVYGPHMAVLFGRTEALEPLEGPNHYFNQLSLAGKFELGCQSYEGCAGLVALKDYLRLLAGDVEFSRDTVVKAFRVAKCLEMPVMTEILGFLNSRDDVRVIGPTEVGPDRHPTISFVHDTKSPEEISDAVCAQGIGVRWGHAYAARLCSAVGVNPDTGVVRASGVHYNTPDEAMRLVSALKAAIDA
jgi:cysteine desulfurase family protein (TIGR01976 family)